MKLGSLALVLCCFGAACQRSGAEKVPEGSTTAAPAPEVKAATVASGPSVGAPRSSELLAVGAPMPPVSGVAQNGERIALAELRGKPVVVYFYPKDDTPGCTVEAQEIRDLWKDIQATTAVVVGVSTDDAESHKAFADKHALPFLLLPDPEHAIAQAFGVPLRNGRASRVSFVFDRQGKLAKVFPEVKPRGHGAELLATLKSLGG